MLDPGIDIDGWPVTDPAGDRIGTAVRRYADAADGPGWVLVRTGLLGDDALVPLHDVQTWDNQLAVRFYRSWVKDAPLALPGAAPEVMRRMVAHYRAVEPRVARPVEPEATAELPASAVVAAATDVAAPDEPAAEPAPAAEAEPAAEAVSAAEPVTISYQRRPFERVRLRKRVVTQAVSQDVTLVREDAVVDRVPVDDGPAEAGVELSEGVYELVLHTERPVVSKRVVPVERVRVRVVPTTVEVAVPEQPSDAHDAAGPGGALL